MEALNKNCKLCHKLINDENFKTVDEFIKDILDTLLLKMTFSKEAQHLICSTCSDKLFAAYSFKSMCLSTNYTITPHLKGPSSVNLKEIYVKLVGSGMLKDKQICRLCMQPSNSKYLSVRDVEADTVKVYIPEIDFNVTVDPIICKICHDSLVTHSSFIKNCFNVKQRAQEDNNPIMDSDLSDSYIKTEDMEIKHEVENEENQHKEVKTCKADTSIRDTHLSDSYIKTEEIEIKDEEEYEEDQEIFSETQLEEEIKPESDPFLKKGHLSKVKKCDTLGFEVEKSSVSIRHQVRHKDPSEVKMYKCSECKYETRHKSNLITHRFRHKDPSEVQMYKCSQCEYETKVKRYLTKHQVRHKDPSEGQMYKCSECKFETKVKRYLRKHQMRHKAVSEMQLYKCNECEYETKSKRSLGKHLLYHRDNAKIKCNECEYETVYKHDFNLHQLKHKKPSEVQMYKCSKCQYETRYKRYFNRHLQRHKDSS